MNNMPLEADARLLIDNQLAAKGWSLTGKDKNVYCEQPKTNAEREKLMGKRPDYVLYSKDSDTPLAVIEAKKKGERIDKALEQGTLYARELDAPLVFATDGVFCRAYHAKFDRTPILNGDEIDALLRETIVLKFLNDWNVNTISERVLVDRRALIGIFDEANNMLRADGLRAGIERFGEFANILFLKLINESEQIKQESGIASSFDTSCSWDVIKNIPPGVRIDYINNMVYKPLNTFYGTDIFTPLTIRDNSILKEIMGKLDSLKLTDVDSDVKGDAFEYFLKASAASKNDLGEYFTPRNIVKTMVRLVNPQIGEKVYDPFCGTGGFLIETFRHIYGNMPKNPLTEKILREDTIFGNEITNTTRITKMNMILAGDGHSNIKMQDSLANPVEGLYDVVIANMPYSQKTKCGNLYDIPSNNGDSICVQHCMKAINGLSENGRVALVVPEGFLFRKDLAKTRQYLLENAQLQSIISLPQGVFLPYTGVKTNIIYASKINQKLPTAQRRKDFWYFTVKSDGYSLDNHRRKLDTPSDLIKYEEYCKLDDEQKADKAGKNGFELIPLDKVRENNCVLAGSRYRERAEISSNYESVYLCDVAAFIRGVTFPKEAQKTGYSDDSLGIVTTRAAQSYGIDKNHIIYIDNKYRKDEKYLKKRDILISLANSLPLVGRVTFVDYDYSNLSFGAFMGVIRVDKANEARILPEYLFHVLRSENAKHYFLTNAKTTTNISNLTFEDLGYFSFPLPPIGVQREIADELGRYERIIGHARGILENYRPVMPALTLTKYPCVELGRADLFEICSGGTPDSENEDYWGKNISKDVGWITLADLPAGDHVTKICRTQRTITQSGLSNSSAKLLPVGSVVVSSRATIGRVGIAEIELATNQGFKNVIIKDKCFITPDFLAYSLKEKTGEMLELASGATFKEISKSNFATISIHVPQLDVQKQIMAQIEAERALIEPSKQLIELFTKKIHDKLSPYAAPSTSR